jgi:hypothetical protein
MKNETITNMKTHKRNKRKPLIRINNKKKSRIKISRKFLMSNNMQILKNLEHKGKNYFNFKCS